MQEFTRNEILVIAAAKGHFSSFAKSDEAARKVIQHIIYANPRRYFQCEITVLRTIWRKSRDWTVEGWDDRIAEIYLKARDSNFFSSGKLIETELSAFEENLVHLFLDEITHLPVRGDNDKEILDLTVVEEERNKVLAILDK